MFLSFMVVFYRSCSGLIIGFRGFRLFVYVFKGRVKGFFVVLKTCVCSGLFGVCLVL